MSELICPDCKGTDWCVNRIDTYSVKLLEVHPSEIRVETLIDYTDSVDYEFKCTNCGHVLDTGEREVVDVANS
jgi:hypothetical protein